MYVDAGESTTVEIPLDTSAFAFYSPKKENWIAERGTFSILVGASSSDIRLQQDFRLKKSH